MVTQEKIEQVRKQFDADVAGGSADGLRTKYLGRKNGLVTELYRELVAVPLDEKKILGPQLSSLGEHVEQALAAAESAPKNGGANIDLTVPSQHQEVGHLHPITQIQHDLIAAFVGIGFDVAHGPEIDTDFYNFESLNVPEHHPARDMQDTFYLDVPVPKGERGKNVLLRTQISNMQVRYLHDNRPPFSVVMPGRVYRNEALDASHEHTYQYMEGMAVGPNVTYANMAWTLDYAIKCVFGKDVRTKLLPSYFPFVEPGAELAISCLVCRGTGCPVCKHTGWVEILGCGMIHQKVFQYAGYAPNELQGFAFGFGLSRLALMRYGIPDIRLLRGKRFTIVETILKNKNMDTQTPPVNSAPPVQPQPAPKPAAPAAPAAPVPLVFHHNAAREQSAANHQHGICRFAAEW